MPEICTSGSAGWGWGYLTCPPKTDPIIILGSLEDKIMKKRFTTEQIIGKLREAEVLLSKGEAMETVCRQIGVTDQTYYRWRKEYGGVRLDQAKRLKELEKENAQLRKIVTDLTIDNSILKEASRGNY